MKFNKEGFKEYLNCFKYNKQKLKLDILIIIGRIEEMRIGSFEYCLNDINNIPSNEVYYADENSTYIYKNINMFYLLFGSPLMLLGTLLFRLLAGLIFIVGLPIAFLYNIKII